MFERELEGFDIDNIVISPADDAGNTLLVQPRVGDTALKENRLMVADRTKGGANQWAVTGDVSIVAGYAVIPSAVWTGGMILPLAEWTRFELIAAQDGALLIKLEEKALIDFFYFFPVPITDEIWLRYPWYHPAVFAFPGRGNRVESGFDRHFDAWTDTGVKPGGAGCRKRPTDPVAEAIP